MDTQASLPTVDELIPPFKRKEGKKGALSKEERQEREDTDSRHARLQEVLEEVTQLRTFVESTREQHEYVRRQITDLETKLREAEASHGRLEQEANQVRWQNVEFMRNVLIVAMQLAALAEDPGQMSYRYVGEAIRVELSYGSTQLVATSDSSVIKISTRRGSEGAQTTRQVSFDDKGIGDLELIGLAQIVGWSGSLPGRIEGIPRHSKEASPVRRERIVDPLEHLLGLAAKLGYEVVLKKAAP